MERFIGFFEPYYHAVCLKLFGADITVWLSEHLGIPWWRVHEYVIAWLCMILIAVVIIEEIRLKRKRCGTATK